MSEEKQNNPKFEMKKLKLNGAPVKLTLDCATAAKTGESTGKFGVNKWFLWFALVENVEVLEGERGKEKVNPNYTGKVIFFAPNEYVNNQLEKLAAGKIGAEITVARTVKEIKGKLMNNYTIEKLSDGKEPEQKESDLTPGEARLVSDAKSFKKTAPLSEKDFIDSSKDKIYGTISVMRAKTLYALV